MSDYESDEERKIRRENKENSRDVKMLVIVFGLGFIIVQFIKACS